MYSLKPIITETKSIRNVKENVSCASSEIHLLSIFETLGQKFEVLLSIFCDTKITLEWVTPCPLFKSSQPLIKTYFLNLYDNSVT